LRRYYREVDYEALDDEELIALCRNEGRHLIQGAGAIMELATRYSYLIEELPSGFGALTESPSPLIRRLVEGEKGEPAGEPCDSHLVKYIPY
jgi:hypothetical protein